MSYLDDGSAPRIMYKEGPPHTFGWVKAKQRASRNGETLWERPDGALMLLRANQRTIRVPVIVEPPFAVPSLPPITVPTHEDIVMSIYAEVRRLVRDNTGSTAAQLVTASKSMVQATPMAAALVQLTADGMIDKTGSGAGATYAPNART